MIKINNIHDNCICKLYDNDDNLIGEINSYLQLTDIRIQILREQIEGYYIVWFDKSIEHDRTIIINKFGNLDSWPFGFFDLYDKQLDVLLNLDDCNFEEYYITS